MSYRDDLKAAFAAELDCDADDIIDVEVRWEDGYHDNPTDGGYQDTPKFDVYVTQIGQPYPVKIDTAFSFTQLLRMVLGVGGYTAPPGASAAPVLAEDPFEPQEPAQPRRNPFLRVLLPDPETEAYGEVVRDLDPSTDEWQHAHEAAGYNRRRALNIKPRTTD